MDSASGTKGPSILTPADMLVSLGSGGGQPIRIAISRSALDNAPVAMALLQPDGPLLWVNKAMERLLHCDPATATTRDLASFVHPEDRERHEQVIRVALSQDSGFEQHDERWIDVEGDEHWVSVSVSIAVDAHDKPLVVGPEPRPCLIVQVIDITERRVAEAEAAASRELLAQRNTELERSNEDLTRFAYVASHDLSEPLRVIAGHVELLARKYRGQLDEEADRWIEFAVDGCARQRRLIDDLLRYSRVGRSAVDKQSVDLAVLVDGVLADLGPLIADTGADISAGTDLPIVRSDPGQLRQVLVNLIANSVKFASAVATPVVRISVQRLDAAWCVRVGDNGPGVPVHYREQVFGIFQRLHSREVPGTGIGLAICRRIVQLHGGTIWIEDNPGGGALFCFTLPDSGAATHGMSDPARPGTDPLPTHDESER